MWLPQLSTTNISIVLADRTITTDCSLIAATVLATFETRPNKPADDIARRIKVPIGAVRAHLSFFMQTPRLVIRETATANGRSEYSSSST